MPLSRRFRLEDHFLDEQLPRSVRQQALQAQPGDVLKLESSKGCWAEKMWEAWLEAIASRLEAIALRGRPSLLGWRQLLSGWRRGHCFYGSLIKVDLVSVFVEAKQRSSTFLNRGPMRRPHVTHVTGEAMRMHRFGPPSSPIIPFGSLRSIATLCHITPGPCQPTCRLDVDARDPT